MTASRAAALTLTGLALASLFLAAPVAAEDVVAEVVNVGDALVFRPVVEADEVVLTVSGPCDYTYTEAIVEEGVFRLDETTIDGRYTFQLVAIPVIDPAIVKVLNEARHTGDNGRVDELCRAGKLPGDPLTQSSGFHVSRGEIIYDPGAFEKLAGDVDGPRLGQLFGPAGHDAATGSVPLKDQVIPDDLIVQGSACVGFDCVNNENFSFDTIRMKENNLRIKFDDTSTISGFPNTDWQLTANDSASGGAGKFSIEDISGARVPVTVRAGAATNSLFISSTSRIGARTSTPVLDVHVNTSNTPGIRLEQNSSGGFTAQTWDIAGNEANFFVRDVTGGSRLPFRIRPDAPTSSIDISSDGEVGIGTASPSSALHVLRSDGTAKVAVEETSGTAATRTLFQMTNNGNVQMQFGNGATTWNFLNNNDFTVTDVGDAVTEFRLTPAGALFIAGSITTGGPTCGAGCDRVFAPDFELESIEEHANQMWTNSHLPAVGPTGPGLPFNVTEKAGGMLNELEKAHIYIEQLHKTIQDLAQRVEQLESR